MSRHRFTCLDVATAAGLEAGAVNGQERLFRCPRHDDERPSLSINPSKDAWMCGPCGTGGNAWQLAAFLAGADPDDKPAVQAWLEERGVIRSASTNGKPRGRIVETYPYLDEEGQLLFEVVRFEPKRFVQRRPDGKGGWTWNLGDVRRVLYHLPRLLDIDENQDVFVVEGERDVHAIEALGLTATTCPGGAGKWRDDYATQFLPFQAPHVVILPDNDAPGRKHAQQVARSLHGKVASVKILELPALPPKGDVSDWIAGRDPDEAAEALCILADRVDEWRPPAEEIASMPVGVEPATPEAEARQEASADDWTTPDHWKRLDVAKVREWNCEPLRPIVDGIIVRGNFVLVAAQSQTGKTLWGLHLARDILQSTTLFGRFPISRVNRVAYMMLEDPDRRARDRILDVDHEFPEPLENERLVIHVAPGFSLADDRMLGWMEHVIVSEKRDVVFLDTYQKATPGITSFDDEKQGVILHRLADLTRRLGVTFIVFDHFRKAPNTGKARELSIDDVKGTGGKAQNADCVILMERTPDKRQIKFQSSSKDFDEPVRILLDVAPRGSTQPKFTYAGDLEAMGTSSSERARQRRSHTLEAMAPAEWMTSSLIAETTGQAERSVRRYMTQLAEDGLVEDNALKGKLRAYRRIPASNAATTNGHWPE